MITGIEHLLYTCLLFVYLLWKTAIEAETRMVITKATELEMLDTERCWLKDTKLQLRKMKKSCDLMHSRMTAVNSITLYTINV